MNNLTTPIAILISGILIALVIAFKDNFPKYTFVKTNAQGYFKMNTQTGYVCYGNTNEKELSRVKKEYPDMKFCDE
jgi:hypothetical protein